jgi:HD-GYP domain-containing protein (c-di-GMP phosphodiesterase class II)
MLAGYVEIRLSQLRPGNRLHAPIYDARSGRSQLLLAAGAELSPKQLELLAHRGISQVLVHRSDVEELDVTGSPEDGSRAGLETAFGRPAEPRKSPPPTWKHSDHSFLNVLQPPDMLPHDPEILAAANQSYTAALATTRNLFDEFVRNKRINAAAAISVAEQQLVDAARDLDVHTSLAARPVVEGYPSRHSLQTSMLAVSIGTIMGLSKDELIELSAGCLLHDAGMMLVPRQIWERPGPLSPAERLEILKHPLYIANALSHRKDVPYGAKATAYQIHERMNGSGYPRKRQHPQIHLFARIGGVADTFLAMISPRHGRAGISPYQAVEKILYATRVGLFDPSVVRALLHATSLFPVGSTVTLSDGRIGRVMRANREDYDRPVVEITSADFDEPPEIVNLSQHDFLAVVGAGQPIAVSA